MTRLSPNPTYDVGRRGTARLAGAARAARATGTALLLLPLALGACGGDAHQAAGDPGDPPVVRAAVATAERTETARRVEIQGTVEADVTSSVSTRVMARVTVLHVAAGDRVRKGQVLLEIDPQAAQGQLSQARGARAQARARLALAERNYRRFEELRKTNAASELELDQARTQYEQAQGAVEQAEGAVAAAAAVASDSTVRAPYAGRVERRMVEVGDLAAPGRPLLRIQSGDARRLALPVPGSLVSRAGLKVGDELPVAIDVRPDRGVFEGTVVEMTPGADPVSHSFDVKVRLPLSQDAELPTGVTGRAWLPGGVRTSITVPTDAVLTQGGMDLVVVRAADGTARTRVVSLGASTDGRVEVLAGLEGGETVLRGLPTVPPSGARIEEISHPGESAAIEPRTAMEPDNATQEEASER